MNDIAKFIREVPKTELHLHIEGTLEPELMFNLAKRNNIKIPYSNNEGCIYLIYASSVYCYITNCG